MAQRKDNKGRKLRTGEYYNAKTGIYQFRKMINGQRVTISDTDLVELRKRENELLVEMDKGVNVKNRNSNMTLNEYFDFWLNTFANTRRKATTITTYRSYYDTYIRETIGTKAISKITKVDVQIIINNMIKNGLQNSTLSNLKSCLNKVFECALDDDIVRKNPCKSIELPLPNAKKREAIDPDQIVIFMDYIKSSERFKYHYPLFVVLFNSGMRIGELAGLTWSDIDFSEGTININKSLNRYRKKDHGFTVGLGTPKSKTSKRVIAFNNVIKKALLVQKMQNTKTDTKISLPFVDDNGVVIDYISDFVFLNKRGNVWSGTTVAELIRTIVEDQNKSVKGTDKPVLKEFSPHMVRHTFTSVAYETGADVKIVSEILGHASTNVTLDRYTHLSDKKKKEQESLVKTIKIS